MTLKRYLRAVAGAKVRMALTATLPIFLCAGCGWMNKDVPFFSITERFSVNVAYVNDGWPSDPTKLSLEEQETLRTMGTPEMAHLWWHRTRPIVTAAEVHQMKTALTSKFNPMRVSWIYLEKEKEVIFKKNGGLETIPLSDKMRILCEVGDPSNIKHFVASGRRAENWIYYNHGRIFRFVDDVLVAVEHIPAVPNYRGP